MSKRKLPELEQTIGEMALDLMRAPRLWPEMVRSDPLDQRGEVSPNAVRVTQHYVAGLLAYGFDVSHEDLQDATLWFATEFPNEYRTRVDSVEMTRLEALLLLDVGHTHVNTRKDRMGEFLDDPVVGSRLAHVHASDNNGLGDLHLPPGTGNIDWPAVFAALREIRGGRDRRNERMVERLNATLPPAIRAADEAA